MKIIILTPPKKENSIFDNENYLYHWQVAIDISNAVRENGHQSLIQNIDSQIFENIFDYQPQLIFNLSNTLPTDFFLKIPFSHTGPEGEVLALTLNKTHTQKFLAESGFQIHQSRVLNKNNWKSALDVANFPIFVKPVIGGCSEGIYDFNLIKYLNQASSCFMALINLGYELFQVEEFLPGREFSVALLGNNQISILPIMEYRFPEKTKQYRSFFSKMRNPEKEKSICPAKLEEPLLTEIRKLAINAFIAFKLKDFARIDIRCNKKGQPFIIDINSIPNLSRENSSYVKMAKEAGFNYPQLIMLICKMALERSCI